MDDRSQKIRLNNPIPLHFYSPEERLPDRNDWTYKIVIRKSAVTDSGYDFSIASYDHNDGKWTDDHLYEMDGVIAWATFWPEWVLGVDL